MTSIPTIARADDPPRNLSLARRGSRKPKSSGLGLDNSSDHDLGSNSRRRLQAALTAPHGLRTVLAVTTEWRHLYDALPMDPLTDSGSAERAALLAQEGWKRAAQPDIAEPLQAALSTTATIISLTKPFASSDTLFSTFEASS